MYAYPTSFNDELIETMKNSKKSVKYVDIPLQHSHPEVLKRMKRRHTREDVIALCQKIRAVRPEADFGADFICGFPRETFDQFMNTVKLVEEAGITKLHVFPYSERSGAPAALMPQIPVNERRRRAKILREAGEKFNGMV